MIWVIFTFIEMGIIAILISVFGMQEKKYDEMVSDKDNCILCEKARTDEMHQKYLDMAEKNWYLSQRNKSLVTILIISKNQPEVLHMDYMNEFLKEEDEKHE